MCRRPVPFGRTAPVRSALNRLSTPFIALETGRIRITSPMTWHHHGKIGDEPMVELNGLDLHIVNRIGASFRDGYPAKCSPLMTSVRHARWLSS